MIRCLLLAAVLTVPLTACKSVNTVATNNPRRTNVDYSRIDMNPGLKNDVRVEGVLARDVNGLLQGQVTLLNRSSSAKDLQTRFEWFSAQGMQVDESSTVWNTYTLQAGEMRSITGTAGSASAKDFRFAIKPLR
ncbi:MAG: YcfL family protein [Planctomycetota bacterium]|nr:YcfL family protein [Planctomycetota bacterium]